MLGRQDLAALGAAALKHLAAILGGKTCAEAVTALTHEAAWLKCPFHGTNSGSGPGKPGKTCKYLISVWQVMRGSGWQKPKVSRKLKPATPEPRVVSKQGLLVNWRFAAAPALHQHARSHVKTPVHKPGSRAFTLGPNRPLRAQQDDPIDLRERTMLHMPSARTSDDLKARRGFLSAALLSAAVALGFSLVTPIQPAQAADLAEIFDEHDPMSTKTVDHSQWASLLTTYVSLGSDGITRVDYAALGESAADVEKLGAYIDLLQETRVSSLNQDEQFAFWANLYNAVTVEVILEHYPVRSIRDISISPGLFSTGPWGKKLVTVEGEELSLDNVEHDIMRANWDEPRVHYAVNCASFGCPNLALEPFSGKKLEAQLEKAAKDYVNHPRGVSFEGSKLTLSKIYDWYGKDFGATKAAQIKSIAKHADPELADKLKAHSGRVSYDYDWSLNDTANGPDGS